MKLNHCDTCGIELSQRFEDHEIDGYITHHTIYGDDLEYKHFCDEDCQKEYHDEYCDEIYNVSDQASSGCSNCGLSREEEDL